MSKQQSPRAQREVQQPFLSYQSSAQSSAQLGSKYPGGVYVKAATQPQFPTSTPLSQQYQSNTSFGQGKFQQAPAQQQYSTHNSSSIAGGTQGLPQQQPLRLPSPTKQFAGQSLSYNGSYLTQGRDSAQQLQQFPYPANATADVPPNVPMEHMTREQSSYSNPKTIFFHMLFKGLAIIIYVFGGWVTSSFVLQFVVIVVLVAVDFWVVKNVSGRLLVGLRYWNESDESGNSIWRFESLDQRILDRLNAKDTAVFWTTLYAIPAVWTLFGVVALLKFNFDYLMIVIIALTMSTSNIVGFTKCHKDAKKRAQTFAQRAMGGFMRDAVTGSIMNNLSKTFSIF